MQYTELTNKLRKFLLYAFVVDKVLRVVCRYAGSTRVAIQIRSDTVFWGQMDPDPKFSRPDPRIRLWLRIRCK